MSFIGFQNRVCRLVDHIREFADTEYQERVWVRAEGTRISSYCDAMLGVLEDCRMDVVPPEILVQLRLTEQHLTSIRRFVDALVAFQYANVTTDMRDEQIRSLRGWQDVVSEAKRCEEALDDWEASMCGQYRENEGITWGNSPHAATRNPTKATFYCPCCGYPDLPEPPYAFSVYYERVPSHDFCPCCGFGFGITDGDRGIGFREWRQRWILGGLRWVTGIRPAPVGWDGRAQLDIFLGSIGECLNVDDFPAAKMAKMRLFVLCSAIMGLAAASICTMFYAGFFGVFTLMLFVPGVVALVCASRLRPDQGGAIGLVASIVCLLIIYLGATTLAHYGLPRFGR